MVSSPSSDCPRYILDFILQQLQPSSYRVATIETAKSAQQRVWIVELTSTTSASPSSNTIDENNNNTEDRWKQVLKSGRNRLVVRQWLGGSRWWNLHRNTNPIGLSRSEIFGYQCARTAFERLCSCSNDDNNKHNDEFDNMTRVVVPRVLWYSSPLDCDDSSSSSSSSPRNQEPQDSTPPWAVLEYVGAGSIRLEYDQVNSSYLDSMVVDRFEFGFWEPHPRWGRVPVEDALDYAMQILQQVMIPLHQQSSSSITLLIEQNPQKTTEQGPSIPSLFMKGPPKTYKDMIQLYQDACSDMVSSHKRVQQQMHSSSTVSTKNNGDYGNGDRMTQALTLLEYAVQTVLPSNLSRIPPLSPVLVHLDLQPQNLLFRNVSTQQHQQQQRHLQQQQQQGQDQRYKCKTATCSVSSVLDWEDAAIADPRFDLMLLGRKVCANRDQAETIWNEYAATMKDSLGPLDPWLQLETVHSITTLLLQSMDLLNGGRNPWETSNDLWKKLDREFQRQG